ncbi:MAG TPA: 1,4-dihydroxy-6-naphthoate synthase [Candidatus Baltobacteraceae bacterium]|jgi:1,4-dihydroxy-6-naphthoate synthase|nr:1,4-dihydroxy-6-naphthoate synthase [Candidatus Baltobacteraceae bacterium]
MPERVTLAYSPCPNDTYIFAALTNGLLDNAPAVRVQLEDVENLNNSALKGDYELTKVSYGAIPMLMDKYRILRAGGALGTGCGPLLVARAESGAGLDDFRGKLIAIPGEMTTAFMLMRLAMGIRPQTVAMRFDLIIDAVAGGTVDAGLIIHESRFTYQERGLVAVADLGDWWEHETGMPIPLGAILVRDDLDDDFARRIDDAIVESIAFARSNDAEVMKYVRQHATEMSEDVMRKHIATYVNGFSEDVGDRGITAVNELFRRAHEAQIIPQSTEAVFV